MSLVCTSSSTLFPRIQAIQLASLSLSEDDIIVLSSKGGRGTQYRCHSMVLPDASQSTGGASLALPIPVMNK